MNPIINKIDQEQMRFDHPEFRPGDTVKVHIRIIEGSKERIQVFQGVVIKRKRGDMDASYTVRKVSHGVGVEKTFALHNPRIEKIELVAPTDATVLILGAGTVGRWAARAALASGAHVIVLDAELGKLREVKEICHYFLGIDPAADLIPVRPAQHYSMGGIWVGYVCGANGLPDPEHPETHMTSVPGLAIGDTTHPRISAFGRCFAAR